ncbi:MAG: hypothetical protein HOV96_19220 [Nonomuraea sp.]|nr:hypothetical protein [Streptomyces sp.]NUP79672.1 hypothetical protein [Nonomuraea sp.]NUS03702.1 hypothetical protein [Nonomuraea sp.]
MSLRIITALTIAASLVGGLAPAAEASAAARSPNVRACYDGRCTLTLTKGVSFRVSPRFGITRVSISFTSERVHVKGTGGGGTSEAFFGKGGSGSVNDIDVRIVSLSTGRAVLRLTPKR